MPIFTEEVETIKDYLTKINDIPRSDQKINYSIELFEYIQTRNDFLAINPRFRRAVINKLDEFNSNEFLQKSYKMLATIKTTYQFLDDLKIAKNYVLEENETPKKIINIII